MTRAGERVKGATSARPFRSRQRGWVALRPASSRAGAKPRGSQRPAGQSEGDRTRGGGVVKSLGRLRPVYRCPCHAQVFFSSWRISGSPARLTARQSDEGQACANPCNAPRPDGGDFFALAMIGQADWVLPSDPSNTGAEGAANAGAARFSHPLACCFGFGLPSLGHWRERQTVRGTVGTVRTLSLSHRSRWPFARSGLFPLAVLGVGTVGTAKGERRGRKIRALVASPARAHRSGGAEL